MNIDELAQQIANMTDEERLAIKAKVEELADLCPRCWAKCYGDRCWGCYESPADYD